MAWIESHEELADHYKTQQLAKQLQCSIFAAVGLLHLLWHYTLKVAWKDGNLEKLDAKAIARACWWDENPEVLFSALKDSGFIDGAVIHDWKKYAKHIIYQRKYNERKRANLTAVKRLYKHKQNSHFTPATIPDLTVPNQTTVTAGACAPNRFTRPDISEVTAYAKSIGFEIDAERFVNFYESKGWLIGKSPMKSWKAAVRTWRNNGYGKPVGNGAESGSFPKWMRS